MGIALVKKSMNIVVPKETYASEKRVMVLPDSAKILVSLGHKLYVQAGAGSGIEISDKQYKDVGASIISDPPELYSYAEKGMIIKMKSPSPEEFSFMNKSILFCMLHVEQNKENLYYLGSHKLVGVAMEEIRNKKDERLVDQTSITGQMGVYYAMRHFQKIPEEMKAVILGYGSVAHGAITACSKLGISYKIMRKSELKNLNLWLEDADLLVNAISWPEKERTQKKYLVTREDIKKSKQGMIVLDLAVDFPNPIQTIHSTNYQNPFYMEEGRVHISIYGYPGLVPVTSSRIYSEQILPFAMAIANNNGLKDIAKLGDIGDSIKRAIVKPSRYGSWKKYKPEIEDASKIE